MEKESLTKPPPVYMLILLLLLLLFRDWLPVWCVLRIAYIDKHSEKKKQTHNSTKHKINNTVRFDACMSFFFALW